MEQQIAYALDWDISLLEVTGSLIIVSIILVRIFIFKDAVFDALVYSVMEFMPLYIFLFINELWLAKQKETFIFVKSLNKLIIQCKCPLRNLHKVDDHKLDDIYDVQVEEKSYSGFYGIGSQKFTVVNSITPQLRLQTDEDESLNYMNTCASKIRRYVSANYP